MGKCFEFMLLVTDFSHKYIAFRFKNKSIFSHLLYCALYLMLASICNIILLAPSRSRVAFANPTCVEKPQAEV
jgi:hypothetical protein